MLDWLACWHHILTHVRHVAIPLSLTVTSGDSVLLRVCVCVHASIDVYVYVWIRDPVCLHYQQVQKTGSHLFQLDFPSIFARFAHTPFQCSNGNHFTLHTHTHTIQHHRSIRESLSSRSFVHMPYENPNFPLSVGTQHFTMPFRYIFWRIQHNYYAYTHKAVRRHRSSIWFSSHDSIHNSIQRFSYSLGFIHRLCQFCHWQNLKDKKKKRIDNDGVDIDDVFVIRHDIVISQYPIWAMKRTRNTNTFAFVFIISISSSELFECVRVFFLLYICVRLFRLLNQSSSSLCVSCICIYIFLSFKSILFYISICIISSCLIQKREKMWIKKINRDR